MNYSFDFLKTKCWWKEVCNKYNLEGCDAGCIRYMKMHFLTANSLLTERQQYPVTLEVGPEDVEAFRYLKEIKDDIENFVNWGENLLIMSKNNGNGKTSSAVKMLMSYFSKTWAENNFTVEGLFINVAKLTNSLKDNIDKKNDYLRHIKDYVENCGLVIWDDIGLKSLTAFEHDYLYSYINHRMDNARANIFTSNLTNDELKSAVGDRLYSRIVNNSEVVEIKGADRRRMWK